jgi:hypothetical protein
MKHKIKFIPVSTLARDILPKPTPAQKAFPEWYKKQEKFASGSTGTISKEGVIDATIKKCPAISDAMTMGYMLYFPVDIYVNTKGPKITWKLPPASNLLEKPPQGMHGGKDFGVSTSIVAIHSGQQISNYPLDLNKYMEDVFKVHPHWVVRTKKGYSTMYVHPMHHELPFKIIPGVIDTDKYASNGAFSMFFERGFEGTIKAGTPLVQVIPFKREDFKMETSFNEDEIYKLKLDGASIRAFFTNGYRSLMWTKKTYN